MKPRDPIWNFYNVIEVGKNLKAMCKDCNLEVSAKVIRLRSHREKCPGISKPAMKAEKRPIEEVIEECLQSAQPSVVESMQPPKRPMFQQYSAGSYGTSTDTSTWEQLDEQIAKLFFACNLPFNTADHPVWKATVEMLRPGYHSPNHEEIGGPLLEKVHQELTTKIKTEPVGIDAVMMQDGWSDIHNTTVVTTSLHTEENAYLMSAVDPGSNTETAAYSYSMSIAQEAIKNEKDSYECRVTGVVTDNERKMEVNMVNVNGEFGV